MNTSIYQSFAFLGLILGSSLIKLWFVSTISGTFPKISIHLCTFFQELKSKSTTTKD